MLEKTLLLLRHCCGCFFFNQEAEQLQILFPLDKFQPKSFLMP